MNTITTPAPKRDHSSDPAPVPRPVPRQAPAWKPEKGKNVKQRSLKPLESYPRSQWRAMESHLYSLRFLTEAEQSAKVDVRPGDLDRLRAVYGTAD